MAKIHILLPIEHKRFSLDQTGHFQLFLLDFFWILRRVSAHFLDFWILKKIDSYINFLHFILFLCILKVRQFKNELMKSSFLPKYEQKIVRSSVLCSEGRNLDNFLLVFWEKR